MSGIAGFIGNYTEKLMHNMLTAIQHRGPDDHGHVFFPKAHVGLAHNQLGASKNLDTGHQPIWDDSQHICVCFDGEIFNADTLRQQLIEEDFTFHTQSDAELIANLYLYYDYKFLEKIDGVFAFALWDKYSSQIVIARDGCGTKPLYYAKDTNGFIFSSEIKAILQEPSLSREIDHEAIQLYLTYQWAPAPYTPLKKVRKLEPGHAMVVSFKGIEKKWRFYELPYHQEISPRITARDAAKKLHQSMRKTMHKRLPEAQEIAISLHGGVDALSLAAMLKTHPKVEKLHAYMLQSPLMVQDKKAAIHHDLQSQAAQHLGIEVTKVPIETNIWEYIDFMLYHIDEPLGDIQALAHHYIAGQAKEDGHKTIYSGIGAYEICSGYQHHTDMLADEKWYKAPLLLRRLIKKTIETIPPRMGPIYKKTQSLQYIDLQGDDHIISYFYQLPPTEITKLFRKSVQYGLKTKHPITSLRQTLKSLHKTHPRSPALNQQLFIDGKHGLTDHKINNFEKMTSAAQMDSRLPFLDHDVFSYVTRLPSSIKHSGHISAYVLKYSMAHDLPEHILKEYHSPHDLDITSWVTGPLQPFIEDTLSAGNIRKRGIFNEAEVRKLIKRNKSGQINASQAIFTMACIERWCQIFID